jgi:SAM-dependent methyltransferase
MMAAFEEDKTSAGEDAPRRKLPHNTEYWKKEYWDERFVEEKNYEWLVAYGHVASQLSPFLKFSDTILVVGCGNSTFSADLYDAGFKNIINIDFSEVVIASMREENKDREEMEWRVRRRRRKYIQNSSIQHTSHHNCYNHYSLGYGYDRHG